MGRGSCLLPLVLDNRSCFPCPGKMFGGKEKGGGGWGEGENVGHTDPGSGISLKERTLFWMWGPQGVPVFSGYRH